MKLVVNGVAAFHSSNGVRRYFAEVMKYLSWPDYILTEHEKIKSISRFRELTYLGSKDEIYWSPSQRGPLWAKNHVLTVHDCINIEYVHHQDWRLPLFKRLFQSILDNALVVVTISNSTRTVLTNLFEVDPSKIVLIKSPLDVGFHFDVSHIGEFSNRPFVLMVTNSLAHKNTLRACQALSRCNRAHKDLTLRVVGSLSLQALEVCKKAGLEVDIQTNVSDHDLAVWYKQALFLLSPSLQEGHNLPVAEALSVGGRVLCSDIAVHHEFYNGMVLFCPSEDVDGIAEAIDIALDDSPWLKLHMPAIQKSFADVATEYQVLFNRISKDGELLREHLL